MKIQQITKRAAAAVLIAATPGIVPNTVFAQSDCKDWNSNTFFMFAGADEVRTCLAAGADAEARDKEGVTPLHRAAGSDRVDAIMALLAAGADVDARDKEKRDAAALGGII